MFKSWKGDKYKIKAVFRLEFEATQVPKSKKSGVSISLVPDDVGKPTLKMEKVPVRDGTCLWENPVYETVRLSWDPKTGMIKEKIYHFIISTGSSKSGFLGEASIDFADFAMENKPFTLSLPLKFANSGVMLHVTIQRMQDNDQSELVGNGVRCIENQANDISLDEDGFFDDEELNDSKQPARSGYEVSLSDSLNNVDGKSRREGPDEAQENRVDKLTSEINSLRRQASLSEMELQSLRKQVMKETKRGQSLSDQIMGLKEEKDALELECQQLRSGQCLRGDKAPSKAKVECEELRHELEAMRQELDCQEDLSSKLRMQLHKTHDSNSELVLTVRDLNRVLKEKDIEISRLSGRKQSKDKLGDLTGWTSNRSMTTEEINGLLQLYNNEHEDPEEVARLNQIVTDQKSEIEACSKRKEELEMQLEQVTLDCEILKQENEEINSKLQEISQQKKELDAHAECSARVQELETQIATLEVVLRQQAEELSESSVYVNELEGQVKGLEKEMEKQFRDFEEEFNAVTQAKVELEQRVIQAEESLRKTKWKNAVAAEKLQEEFKRLSMEMTTKIDENEKLTLEAVHEADELRRRNKDLEDMLHRASGDIQEIDRELSVKSIELQHMQAQLKERQLEDVRAEAERLRKDSCNAREQEKQAAMLIRQKEALETKLILVKKDADEVLKELSTERSSKQKQMQEMEQLRSQVECLVAQNDGLKNRISEEEAAEDKLRRQVIELRKVIAPTEEERKSTCQYSTTVTNLRQKLASLKEKAEIKVKASNGQANGRSIVKELEECMDWLKELEADLPSKSLQSVENNPAAAQNERCDDVSCKSLESSDGVEMLREKNRKMEEELKEMEERYSEVSLRFAMVESERQQLVMTVRNLKNSKNK